MLCFLLASVILCYGSYFLFRGKGGVIESAKLVKSAERIKSKEYSYLT